MLSSQPTHSVRHRTSIPGSQSKAYLILILILILAQCFDGPSLSGDHQSPSKLRTEIRLALSSRTMPSISVHYVTLYHGRVSFVRRNTVFFRVQVNIASVKAVLCLVKCILSRPCHPVHCQSSHMEHVLGSWQARSTNSPPTHSDSPS